MGILAQKSESRRTLYMLSALEQGEVPLSPGLAARLLEEFARQAVREKVPDIVKNRDETGGRLTERQTEVLNLVAKGMMYKEVGAALGLSERTIKYHMERILELLQLENRAQLLAYTGQKNSGHDVGKISK